jgi:hypothetical protein
MDIGEPFLTQYRGKRASFMVKEFVPGVLGPCQPPPTRHVPIDRAPERKGYVRKEIAPGEKIVA